MKYSYDFQEFISVLIEMCLFHDIKILYIACDKQTLFDKISIAVLYNVLFYLSDSIQVKLNSVLREYVEPNISVLEGKNFQPISIIRKIAESETQYYVFSGDKDVEKPVNEITNIIVEQNITVRQDDIKEFLSTTIGEIFSNCINHSEQDTIYLTYDIDCQDEDGFFLCVNVIDYGKTIIENVKGYLAYAKRFTKDVYDSPVECMEWAIKSGNTTRKRSGGYGLPTLIDYIKSAKGELYIFSGKANFCLVKGEQSIRESQGLFLGTSITFKVKLFDTEHLYVIDEMTREIRSVSLDEL